MLHNRGMRSTLFLLLALPLAAEDLAISGISHVAFRVSDLDAARGFYTKLLGIPEAFQMSRPTGEISIAFLQVNDSQYIELQPGLAAGENVRMTHISLETPDAPRLREQLVTRGLEPTEMTAGRDGNRAFRLKDSEGNQLEFTEYLAGGKHAQARGKLASAPRISSRLTHGGILVESAYVERALAFYRDKMGFVETWRGGPENGPLRWINLKRASVADFKAPVRIAASFHCLHVRGHGSATDIFREHPRSAQ